MQLAQTSASFFRTLGTAAAVAAFLSVSPAAAQDTEQVVKYFRKKSNIPPNATVTVKDLKDSPIKGAKQGSLEIANGPQVREMDFIVSSDGRYVVFAEVEDVTVDPFKKVAEKINLKGKPYKGKDGAKVTIVEYSDFQCPFCARGYSTIENEVLKEYGDKVKFVYKHFPLNFHPWAEPGAVAVECAAQQNKEAYWKLYSYLFENQKEINPQNLKEKSKEALKDTKIDMAKWEKCYDNKDTLAQVKADMAEGQSVGVTGTPAFLINGRLLSGAQPFQQFKNVIDDELASSK
jgi:protein-disulfide isomerase